MNQLSDDAGKAVQGTSTVPAFCWRCLTGPPESRKERQQSFGKEEVFKGILPLPLPKGAHTSLKGSLGRSTGHHLVPPLCRSRNRVGEMSDEQWGSQQAIRRAKSPGFCRELCLSQLAPCCPSGIQASIH